VGIGDTRQVGAAGRPRPRGHVGSALAPLSNMYDQVRASDGNTVVAPGASCRTQPGDRPDANAEPPHPVEKFADALAE